MNNYLIVFGSFIILVIDIIYWYYVVSLNNGRLKNMKDFVPVIGKTFFMIILAIFLYAYFEVINILLSSDLGMK